MFTKIPKLVRLWKELGPLNTVLYVTHVAFSVPSGGRIRIERLIFVSQPVHDTPLLSPGKAASLAVRVVEPGSPLLAQFPRPPEVIADRFAKGAFCLAVVKNSSVQGFIWFIQRHYDEDVARVRFVLPASGRAAWDFDVYVAPAYRLGFTFLRLWDAANAHLTRLGIQRTISQISAFNTSSLSSHGRLGARKIGSATFIIAGRFQVMISSLSPKLRISIDKTRPELFMPE